MAEYVAYIDRLICTGAAVESDKAPFIDNIKAKIEMGEASRQRQIEADHDKLREQAAAKAEAINQHAMGVAVGKSSGKGGSGKIFSTRASPARYTPLAGKSERGEEAIKNILKATDANVVQET